MVQVVISRPRFAIRLEKFLCSKQVPFPNQGRKREHSLFISQGGWRNFHEVYIFFSWHTHWLVFSLSESPRSLSQTSTENKILGTALTPPPPSPPRFTQSINKRQNQQKQIVTSPPPPPLRHTHAKMVKRNLSTEWLIISLLSLSGWSYSRQSSYVCSANSDEAIVHLTHARKIPLMNSTLYIILSITRSVCIMYVCVCVSVNVVCVSQAYTVQMKQWRGNIYVEVGLGAGAFQGHNE